MKLSRNQNKTAVWYVGLGYAGDFGSSSFCNLDRSVFSLIPKKVELLIRFFEPFWISRVFHFSLRTFGEVAAHPDPLGASDETYTQSKFDISGSNETMQNALASIV